MRGKYISLSRTILFLLLMGICCTLVVIGCSKKEAQDKPKELELLCGSSFPKPMEHKTSQCGCLNYNPAALPPCILIPTNMRYSWLRARESLFMREKNIHLTQISWFLCLAVKSTASKTPVIRFCGSFALSLPQRDKSCQNNCWLLAWYLLYQRT